MSDTASTAKPSGSLESRITSPPLKATSTAFTPSAPSADSAPSTSTPAPAPSSSIGSWADEVASPVAEVTNKLAEAQVDGADEPHNGSGLAEPTGSFEVEVKLSDLQKDPNNPLYSVKTFEELGLTKEILKGLYAMNFSKPSNVQEKALPLLLANPPMNMIAQSQSGTGKTAAFVLTVLMRIDLTKPHQPQALCLAPSRELARQIEGVINTIGHFVENLHVQAAIPGVIERGKKIEASIVVGTPGTVMDLIKRRQFDASQIKVLTLDEADNMLDQQGMGEQCARVKSLLPRSTQILLFSATFPEKVLKFAQNFSPNANMITLKKEELTVKGIQQMFMDCPSEAQKYDILVQLYGLLTTGSSIIFVKTRASAAEIERRMVADGHKVASLSGAQEGLDRDRIIDDFRSGRAKVLITTNVLARGIDVSTVTMVINYDIPMKGIGDAEADSETYLHRIGRTGRFGRIGVSISFVYDRKSFMALKDIADGFGIDLVQLNYDDWDETEMLVQSVIKGSQRFNKAA